MEAAIEAFVASTGRRWIRRGRGAKRGSLLKLADSGACVYRPILWEGELIASLGARARGDETARPLLIGKVLDSGEAQRCRDAGTAFLDTAGNALVEEDDVYIFVCGRKIAAQGGPRVAKGGATATASGQRLIFRILIQPDMLNATHREVAKAAGVAVGAVSAVYADLEERGFMRRGNHGRRKRLHREDQLQSEWIAAYPVRLRRKLRIGRFSSNDPQWWRKLDPRRYGMWFGGEVAAERMTAKLNAANCILYCGEHEQSNNLRRLMADHRLRPDENGPTEVLAAFWGAITTHPDPDCVPPLLVRADLAELRDERVTEAMDALRRIDEAPHSI